MIYCDVYRSAGPAYTNRLYGRVTAETVDVFRRVSAGQIRAAFDQCIGPASITRLADRVACDSYHACRRIGAGQLRAEFFQIKSGASAVGTISTGSRTAQVDPHHAAVVRAHQDAYRATSAIIAQPDESRASMPVVIQIIVLTVMSRSMRIIDTRSAARCARP